METMQPTMVNGVDVDRLNATIAAITDVTALGAFQFRAENEWLDGSHNRSTIRSFYGAGQEDESRTVTFVLDNDEPDVLLGLDRGANPAEYVLHALAGCVTTTLVVHAAARGLKLTEVSSKIEGDLDVRGILDIGGARNGFQDIRIKLRVRGEASEAELRDLVAFTLDHSPVFDIVTNPVPVSVEVV